MTFRAAGVSAHVICNAWWEPLDFELPDPGPGGEWRRRIDTSLPSPDDIAQHQRTAARASGPYRVEGRTVVVLVAGGG